MKTSLLDALSPATDAAAERPTPARSGKAQQGAARAARGAKGVGRATDVAADFALLMQQQLRPGHLVDPATAKEAPADAARRLVTGQRGHGRALPGEGTLTGGTPLPQDLMPQALAGPSGLRAASVDPMMKVADAAHQVAAAGLAQHAGAVQHAAQDAHAGKRGHGDGGQAERDAAALAALAAEGPAPARDEAATPAHAFGAAMDAARAAPPAEPAAAPAPVQPLVQPLLEDASLRIAMQPDQARLTLDVAQVGDLSLHLRVRDGVADVSATGAAAHLLERRGTELGVALQGTGLALGQFDVNTRDRSREDRKYDERPSAAAAGPARARPAAGPLPSSPTTEADVDLGVRARDRRVHVKA